MTHHTRIRPFNTRDTYPEQNLDNDLCQAVVANGVVYLRGQVGQNLDTSEQVSLGGPMGLRGYPVNEAAGDEGFIWQSELHYQPPLLTGVSLFALYDAGFIQQHHQTWSGWQPVAGQPNDYGLQDAGLGASWTPNDRLILKATVAAPLGGNPGLSATGLTSDGHHNRAQYFLSLTGLF